MTDSLCNMGIMLSITGQEAGPSHDAVSVHSICMARKQLRREIYIGSMCMCLHANEHGSMVTNDKNSVGRNKKDWSLRDFDDYNCDMPTKHTCSNLGQPSTCTHAYKLML